MCLCHERHSKREDQEGVQAQEDEAPPGVPDQAAKEGKDAFDKTRFVNIPSANDEFYVGTVVPVLHYCMGGLSINVRGEVLGKNNNEPIPGLYACGEVSGGVHGDNRLAGNSLLECVVYGRIVGQTIRDSAAK